MTFVEGEATTRVATPFNRFSKRDATEYTAYHLSYVFKRNTSLFRDSSRDTFTDYQKLEEDAFS